MRYSIGPLTGFFSTVGFTGLNPHQSISAKTRYYSFPCCIALTSDFNEKANPLDPATIPKTIIPTSIRICDLVKSFHLIFRCMIHGRRKHKVEPVKLPITPIMRPKYGTISVMKSAKVINRGLVMRSHIQW